MLVIPLQETPSQTVASLLNNQSCQINVYQKINGVYVDLYVANTLVIAGVLAEDRNRIVRSEYLGFIGDLAFFDTRGTSNPDWTGIGDRFQLAYLFPSEISQAA